MSARTLILASASPARLRLLRDAGLDPKVVATGVLEDGVTGDAWTVVRILARRKAEAAARSGDGALVLGCDSLLDLNGVHMGKPSSPADAVQYWHSMRGRVGTLVTGHCLIDSASGESIDDVAETFVRFGTPSDEEIEAYVATAEPLGVAGAFTLDGRAAAFVDGIDGDAGTVIGVSLPLLRGLLRQLGVELTDLWA